ncbi:MAG: hypothetical protein ABH950_05040 [Candidatus Altiarchaeota archaeon]
MIYLIALKAFITVAMVVGLAYIAERISTKLAGVLVGIPLGSAVTLFFFGLENGPEFAATAAVWNLSGIACVCVFLWAYNMGLKQGGRRELPQCVFFGLVAFLFSAFILSKLPLGNHLGGTIILSASILTVTYIFRKIRTEDIHHPKRLTAHLIEARALFAALVVVAVTESAEFIGPQWSGLFSSFPVTLMPLIVIIHYSYSKEHVEAIIKNEPLSMFSILFYSLSVSYTYPVVGVYWGTLISYIIALVYVFFYWFVIRKAIRF